MLANYNSEVYRYFEDPSRVGCIVADEDYGIGRGQAGMPGRSNVVCLHIRTDKNYHIVEAKFKTHGCGVAIAASAWLAELLQGLSITQAEQLSYQDIVSHFQLQPLKHHCAVLAEDALHAAIEDWRVNTL